MLMLSPEWRRKRLRLFDAIMAPELYCKDCYASKGSFYLRTSCPCFRANDRSSCEATPERRKRSVRDTIIISPIKCPSVPPHPNNGDHKEIPKPAEDGNNDETQVQWAAKSGAQEVLEDDNLEKPEQVPHDDKHIPDDGEDEQVPEEQGPVDEQLPDDARRRVPDKQVPDKQEEGAAKSPAEELPGDASPTIGHLDDREVLQTPTPRKCIEAAAIDSLGSEEKKKKGTSKGGDSSTTKGGIPEDEKKKDTTTSGKTPKGAQKVQTKGKGKGAGKGKGKGKTKGNGKANAAKTDATLEPPEDQGDSGNPKRQKTTHPSLAPEDPEEPPLKAAKKAGKGTAETTEATPEEIGATVASSKAKRQKTTGATLVAIAAEKLPAVVDDLTQKPTAGPTPAEVEVNPAAEADPAAMETELRDIMKARAWKRMMDCNSLHPTHAEAVQVLKEKNGGTSPSSASHGPGVPPSPVVPPSARRVSRSNAVLGWSRKLADFPTSRWHQRYYYPEVGNRCTWGATYGHGVMREIAQAWHRSVYVPNSPPRPRSEQVPRGTGELVSQHNVRPGPGCVFGFRFERPVTSRNSSGRWVAVAKRPRSGLRLDRVTSAGHLFVGVRVVGCRTTFACGLGGEPCCPMDPPSGAHWSLRP